MTCLSTFCLYSVFIDYLGPFEYLGHNENRTKFKYVIDNGNYTINDCAKKLYNVK